MIRFLPSFQSSLVLAAAAVVLSSCSVVGETGRRQFAVLPSDMMNSLGAEAYGEATQQYREITGTPDAEMVQRMGKRIAAACGKDYDWEFKLLDAPDQINAFALPGGKVAIYSGILPIAATEDGLAAVVGHEIAHVTANHGNERMSQNVVSKFGMAAIGMALGSMAEEQRGTIMSAVGAGAQYGVLLPFSRTHESEADEIGLRYLIRAGYDPYEAPKLWDRMAEMAGPNRPQEMMSTHPDPANRAARLRELIPQFLEEERDNIVRQR